MYVYSLLLWLTVLCMYSTRIYSHTASLITLLTDIPMTDRCITHCPHLIVIVLLCDQTIVYAQQLVFGRAILPLLLFSDIVVVYCDCYCDMKKRYVVIIGALLLLLPRQQLLCYLFIVIIVLLYPYCDYYYWWAI